MLQIETDFDCSSQEQFFKIGSISSSGLQSRLTKLLIAEGNDSIKYRIAFIFNTSASAEVNIFLKKFFDKNCLTLNSANVTLTGEHNMVQPCGQVELKCFDKIEICHNLTFYESDAINHAILG